ncbi:MAG TPA: hypothetical protein VGN46_13955 [Luteibacter sp.]|uniref:DUF6911 family protein n=1 Tax=Luteibacter sp. TaxID=1886636 RepID=UPI002F3F5173
MNEIILMSAVDREVAGQMGIYVKSPVWSHVEDRLRRAFTFGGGVQLEIGYPETDSRIRLGLSMTMNAHPGNCRIVYSPVEELGEKSRIHEWWQSNDLPFSGTMVFNDHPFDNRTVCYSFDTVRTIFEDFFDKHDLSEPSMVQFRSVWDKKPRS